MVKSYSRQDIEAISLRRQFAKFEAVKQAMQLSLDSNIEVCMVIRDGQTNTITQFVSDECMHPDKIHKLKSGLAVREKVLVKKPSNRQLLSKRLRRHKRTLRLPAADLVRQKPTAVPSVSSIQLEKFTE